MFDSTTVRAHVLAAGARGHQSWALSRPRGGFPTKNPPEKVLRGLPVALHLTSGEANDRPQFQLLLGIGHDIKPGAVMTDKGYDAKRNRRAARALGIVPMIPMRKITLTAQSISQGCSTRPGLASSRRSESSSPSSASRTVIREDCNKLLLAYLLARCLILIKSVQRT